MLSIFLRGCYVSYVGTTNYLHSSTIYLLISNRKNNITYSFIPSEDLTFDKILITSINVTVQTKGDNVSGSWIAQSVEHLPCK